MFVLAANCKDYREIFNSENKYIKYNTIFGYKSIEYEIHETHFRGDLGRLVVKD